MIEYFGELFVKCGALHNSLGLEDFHNEDLREAFLDFIISFGDARYILHHIDFRAAGRS